MKSLVFPSSSRAAGVKLPGQWGDIYSSSEKSSKFTRTKKKRLSKINGESIKGTSQ